MNAKSPSVISDYESGRRKSRIAVVGKIVDTILTIDEANGGKFIKKFAKILYTDIDDNVIYDIFDYASPQAAHQAFRSALLQAPLRVAEPVNIWLYDRQ